MKKSERLGKLYTDLTPDGWVPAYGIRILGVITPSGGWAVTFCVDGDTPNPPEIIGALEMVKDSLIASGTASMGEAEEEDDG